MEVKDDHATLKSGVVLKLESPSPMALKDALDAMGKEPEVPKVWIEEKDREELNESDPDYQFALMAWQAEAVTRALNVFILTGTSEESRPDGMEGPEEDEFRETLEALQIPVAPSIKGRYLQWVKYVAAKDKEDLQALSLELGRRAGTSEEDVQLALDSFRGSQGRATDNGARAGRPGPDRDRVRRKPARARA